MGFKNTEIGLIPNDWETTNLGTLIERLESGVSVNSSTDAEGKNIEQGRILKTSCVFDGRFIPEESKPIINADFKRAKTNPLADTIIISRMNTPDLVGESGYVDKQYETLFLPDRLWMTKIYKGAPVNTKWLSIIINFKPYKRQIKETATGTSGSMKNISKGSLLQTKIPLPPLPEQTAIAEALSDAHALITSLEKLIEKKRAIKQGAMQELLTGKRRLPGFEKTAGFKQTEIGLMPEDWKTIAIGKLVTDFRGGAPLQPNDFTKIGIKVIPKKAVGRTGWLTFDNDDESHCSEKYAATHPRNQVDELCTVVVLRDLVPSGPSIGLMVQIKEKGTYLLAQGVYGFKLNREAVPAYLVQMSNTDWYRKLVNSIMVGSTQVHITNTAFKELRIPLPTYDEQNAIAEIFSNMDAEIQALEQKLAKYRQIKQGMMQELLTGRIRLVKN